MAVLTYKGEIIGGSPSKAESIFYDNTDSGLESERVQGAVDEVAYKINILSAGYNANNILTFDKDITDEWYNGNLRNEIRAHNFENVHPGAYIIGKTTGTKYYVLECDPWLYKGDTSLTTGHIGVVPRILTGVSTKLWAGKTYAGSSANQTTQGYAPWAADWDTSNPAATYTSTTVSGKNNTSGSYYNSFIKQVVLNRVYNEWLKADFGTDAVLKFRNLLANATNTSVVSPGYTAWSGVSSSWSWYDSYCDLMSEANVYGTNVWSSSGFDTGCQKEQFALFRLLSKDIVFNRETIWLKDVADASNACDARYIGDAYFNYASRCLAVVSFALLA